MTDAKKSLQSQEDSAPFGTTPRRSKSPTVILGVLYAAWFLLLCWMAMYHIGR